MKDKTYFGLALVSGLATVISAYYNSNVSRERDSLRNTPEMRRIEEIDGAFSDLAQYNAENIRLNFSDSNSSNDSSKGFRKSN